MKIKSKNEFYSLQQKGLLGNYTKQWNNLEDFKKSSTPNTFKKFGIRFKIPSYETIYHLTYLDVIQFLYANSHLINIIVIQEMVDHSKQIIQGELSYNGGYLYGHLNTERKPMKEGIKYSKDYYGLQTINKLKSTCDSSSYEDIVQLLYLYPEASIEFENFEYNVGIISNRNTVIWEVRNY